MRVAVYDAKSYDKEFLSTSIDNDEIAFTFFDFTLNKDSVGTAQGYDAVCIFVNDQADEEVCHRLSEEGIGLIALRCAGFNNVDLATAEKLGLSVVRVPAYSPHAVAEHAVGLLLSLNRKIHHAYNRVREMNFSLNGLMGFDLCGKTVGVVGTGEIGKVFAQIMRGFQTKVIAYDLYPSREWAEKEGISYVDSFEELLQRSDILSLHAPLVQDTFHLINESTIAQMKAGVLLVNTSRGKIIKTSSLIQGLKEGRIGGVALDTYEEEEGIFFEDMKDQILQDDELARLLTFPNVLITAHQAFFTREALQEISRTTIKNLLLFRKGASFLPGTQVSQREQATK